MNDRDTTLREIRKHLHGGWVRWSTLDLCFAIVDWAEAIRARPRR